MAADPFGLLGLIVCQINIQYTSPLFEISSKLQPLSSYFTFSVPWNMNDKMFEVTKMCYLVSIISIISPYRALVFTQYLL